MTLSEAREEIKKRQFELLKKTKDGEGYACPICSFGTAEGQDGLKEEEDHTYTCPFGCFNSADVFRMMEIKHNLAQKDSLLRALAKELQIEVEGEEENTKKGKVIKASSVATTDETNYSLFYKECLEAKNKSSFMSKHGIGKELQEKFQVGFCKEWIHPETKEDVRKYITLTPRAIIPTSSFTYIAIYAGDNNNAGGTQRVGKPVLFNKDVLYVGDEPIFVVEDEMDALSIMECGYDAVAFGDFKNIMLIAETLKEKKSSRFLVMCLDDSDEDVLQVFTGVQKELDEFEQEFILFNLAGNFESINQMLIKDKLELRRAIKEAHKKVHEFEMQKVREYQLKNSNMKYLSEFMDKKVDMYVMPTGIKKLDAKLDGGLYEGFYVLNSNKSIGKTTFALQMADNIASSDGAIDVLVFSLEASTKELIAKSLSRLTAMISIVKNKNFEAALTIRDISVKSQYDKLSDKSKKNIAAACEEYEKYASNIYVYEGNNDTSVEHIKEHIKSHLNRVKKANRKAVVILDYLQVLSPSEESSITDNQNMVKNIAELKRISRDFNIPIFALSSMNTKESDIFNTGNYNETDVLYHSSDVLLHMNYVNEKDKNFDENKEKNKNPIPLSLLIMKNRNGKSGEIIGFDYYPPFNLFI